LPASQVAPAVATHAGSMQLLVCCFLLTAICKQPKFALLQQMTACATPTAHATLADAMRCRARQAIPCAISSKPYFDDQQTSGAICNFLTFLAMLVNC
jgi:hypothetical protein